MEKKGREHEPTTSGVGKTPRKDVLCGKSLSAKYVVILVGLLIVGYGEARGADWKKFYKSDIGEYFYDEQNIDRPSRDIVLVYEKSVLTQKGVWGWVQRLGNSFDNLSYTIRLSELNCGDRRWRWLVMAFYSNEDKILKTVAADTFSEWNLINSESLVEPLFEAVCK